MTCVIIKHIFNDTLGLEAGVQQTNRPKSCFVSLAKPTAIKLKTTVSPTPDQPIKFYVS